MSARSSLFMFVWNLSIVTFFAYVTALKDWSLGWWPIAFCLLLLPNQEDKKDD